MTEWLIDLMETLGAPGAGIALESLFPPQPGENRALVRAYVDMGTNAVIATVAPAVPVFVGVRLSERRKGRHAVGG